jgi:hypothetical protein
MEGKKCKCGTNILENLGYTEKCHYCVRKDLMKMSDEEVAGELTREVMVHKKDWPLFETLRRILLKSHSKNEVVVDDCYIVKHVVKLQNPYYFSIVTHKTFYTESDVEYLDEKLKPFLNKKVRLRIEVIEE